MGEGKLEIFEKDRILSNIKTTTSLKDCRNADLVIEAVIEKEDIKNRFLMNWIQYAMTKQFSPQTPLPSP